MRLLVCLLLFLGLSSFTLKEKLAKAQVGDYIVTEQENTLSILSLRALTPTSLVLEEISAPLSKIPASRKWGKWVQEKAPGHTSWTLYEIDLKKEQLISCYSVSKRCWIIMEKSELFFPKLLSLPMKAVAKEERKKIGPAPQSGEDDHRALWIPVVYAEGKKVDKPECEVWRGRWPEDDSLLSLCQIDLYFAKESALPYWIEVTNGHYTLKIRAIDSGKGLISPFKIQHDTIQQP